MLERFVDAIDAELDALIPKENSPLFDAARYTLLAPGKRFRPLLTVCVAQTFGAPLSHSLHPACAVEMIHAYSLIHDDLPCMDDDDMRRGKPSLHRAFGEANAILTGDFLLTYAFEVIAAAPYLSEKQRLSLITTLAHAAGSHGMVGGQVLDLSSSESSLDAIEHLHWLKTGALITAALEMGGIIASVPLEPLRRLGNALGLFFQLSDDLEDGDFSHDSRTAALIRLKELDQEVDHILSSSSDGGTLLAQVFEIVRKHHETTI